jgi:hypothetical protein
MVSLEPLHSIGTLGSLRYGLALWPNSQVLGEAWNKYSSLFWLGPMFPHRKLYNIDSWVNS